MLVIGVVLGFEMFCFILVLISSMFRDFGWRGQLVVPWCRSYGRPDALAVEAL
jgi:hypothetical protein